MVQADGAYVRPGLSGAEDRYATEQGFLRRVDRVSHDWLWPSNDGVDCRHVIPRASETPEGRGSWYRV